MAINNLARVQVVLPYVSFLPEDVAVNTLHFAVDDAVWGTAGASILAQVEAFFNDDTGLAYEPALMVGDIVARDTDVCEVKVYEETGSAPTGPPQYVGYFTMGAPVGGNSMPLECALCSSYYGDPAGAVRASRRRNRFFFGPLTLTVLANEGVPEPDAVEVLALATQRLEGANSAVAAMVGYSPTDEEQFPIIGGWVDNEFDTQRRRQIPATSRETWTSL